MKSAFTLLRPFIRIWQAWIRHRQRYAAAVLDGLKVRYQTFRVMLADNERCLELINELDVRSRASGRAWPDLESEVKELLHLSYELVDGLSRLSGGGHHGLYNRHARLSQAVNEALAAVGHGGEQRPACLPLDKAWREERGLVGGKAKSLAKLIRLGMPAPDGFVITTQAGRRFLVESGVNHSLRGRLRRLENGSPDPALIRHEADAIQEEILRTELPAGLRAEIASAYSALAREEDPEPAVSLRSSAAPEDSAEHSFAGQFSTVLNVRGLDKVFEAFKTVLASGCNARSITYRLRRGLALSETDMAVLCQRMVPAVAAGVLFSLDPTDAGASRALLTAVPGLGLSAVDGEVPADIYYLSRADLDGPVERRTAHKTLRQIAQPAGGVHAEFVPKDQADEPLLTDAQARAIAGFGRMAEASFGTPQDMEWAMGPDKEIMVLQSRPLAVSGGRRKDAPSAGGRVLLQGGMVSSDGRGLGKARLVRTVADLETPVSGPEIAVMRQSLVRAARWLPLFQGVVVELGNPADHLSCVAREYGVPMLTGMAEASSELREGQWILLDAERNEIREVDPALGRDAKALWQARQKEGEPEPPAPPPLPPEMLRLRDLITPLNLTDAYGPDFTVLECKSLHDIVRFVHEKAVLEMFESGDEIVEEAASYVHRIRSDVPFAVLLIDLGGGLAEDVESRVINLSAVRSAPFLALWEGVDTPGLRWGKAPPNANISGLVSRSFLDSGGRRPVGSFNYALITRDYMNVNARVDYHFAMIDTVCGAIARENYIRFRFKGGGTELLQRERRAAFIAEVLVEHDFFVDQRSDLVTGALLGLEREEVASRLAMLGRLMGFSRLLDASMLDDETPHRVAEAFYQGDYDLATLPRV